MSSAENAALVEAVIEFVSTLSTETPVLLIDGPSGAGKSSLAEAIVDGWNSLDSPVVVSMDDIYPGWLGLRAASEHISAELLHPLRSGGEARWCDYDWVGEGAGEWHSVDESVPLIIEGCGTLTAANAPLADVRIWMDADEAVRKKRALLRDHGHFDDYWDLWDDQFQSFVAREDPKSWADLVLDGT